MAHNMLPGLEMSDADMVAKWFPAGKPKLNSVPVVHEIAVHAPERKTGAWRYTVKWWDGQHLHQVTRFVSDRAEAWVTMAWALEEDYQRWGGSE